MSECPPFHRKGFVDLQVNGYMGVDFSGLIEDVHRVRVCWPPVLWPTARR
jgi:hypothetical protein